MAKFQGAQDTGENAVAFKNHRRFRGTASDETQGIVTHHNEMTAAPDSGRSRVRAWGSHQRRENGPRAAL